MLAVTKSHRASRDRDLIRFGKDEAHIRACLMKSGIDYRIDMHLRAAKPKGIAINGQRIRRASELVGLLHVVFFSPEDLRIIKEGPAERRHFIDVELCQLDASYLYDLNHYNRIVDQRNRLLHDLAFDGRAGLQDTLDVWDEQLASFGAKIIDRRAKFIGDLNGIVGNLHEDLSGGREHLTVSYEPNVQAEDLLRKLKNARERDIRLKMTTAGPHRDDFSCVADGIDLRQFGSQGQQRTCALSLKLSEIELVRQTISEDPVLMLDDVLSELDSGRQNYLLNRIGGIQTFITCTGLDEFVKNRFTINRLFRIENGRIAEETKETEG
jgi:DNA replication and repair protein RecF